MIDRFNRVTPVATISGCNSTWFEFGEERLHAARNVEFHGELTTMV